MRILGIDPGLARVGYGVIDVDPQAGQTWIDAEDAHGAAL